MSRTLRANRSRFIGVALAALIAATSVLYGAAGQAHADSGLPVGTYTVSANLYVGAKDTPIGLNAYVTNPAAPPLGYPSSPVNSNATLQVLADGTELLTVPVVNSTFGVLGLPAASTDGAVAVQSSATTPWSTAAGGPTSRISSVTFDVTDFAGGSTVATFAPSEEYANFFLYRGYKAWDLNLVVDFGSAA